MKVSSFEGKQKFSPYDLKQAEKIAVYTLSGDLDKAKIARDEFLNDKKGDKIRNAIISVGTLVAAVATGRLLMGKIASGKHGKLVKDFAKSAVGFADAAFDLFLPKAKKGQKLITKFLNQDIGSSKTFRTVVKKIVNGFYKNAEDNQKHTANIKNVAKWISEKTKVTKYKDLAKVGIAAGIGTIIDEPIKGVANKVDEANDMEKQILNGDDLDIAGQIHNTDGFESEFELIEEDGADE